MYNYSSVVISGAGVLMDGALLGRSRHVITDSDKQKVSGLLSPILVVCKGKASYWSLKT